MEFYPIRFSAGLVWTPLFSDRDSGSGTTGDPFPALAPEDGSPGALLASATEGKRFGKRILG